MLAITPPYLRTSNVAPISDPNLTRPRLRRPSLADTPGTHPDDSFRAPRSDSSFQPDTSCRRRRVPLHYSLFGRNARGVLSLGLRHQALASTDNRKLGPNDTLRPVPCALRTHWATASGQPETPAPAAFSLPAAFAHLPPRFLLGPTESEFITSSPPNRSRDRVRQPFSVWFELANFVLNADGTLASLGLPRVNTATLARPTRPRLSVLFSGLLGAAPRCFRDGQLVPVSDASSHATLPSRQKRCADFRSQPDTSAASASRANRHALQASG